MYNNVYGEYINNMLGPIPNYNRIEPVNFENTINNNFFETSMNSNANTENLEQLYPDLYRLLYPMIQNACMKNTNPLTEETIKNMVEDIYSNFISDEQMFDEVDLDSEFRSGKSSNTISTSTKNITPTSIKKESRTIDKKREFRQDNYVLRDLIRILLLRELMGRPGNRPPNWKQRPAFRPPFNPREFMSNNAIFESNYY